MNLTFTIAEPFYVLKNHALKVLCRTSLVAERNLGSLRKERDDVLCTQIEQLSSLYQYKTRPLTADWLQMFFSDSVRHCSQEHFSKIVQCTFKELQLPLLRLMYIAKTLINPLFTDVAFLRDREGDGSCPPVPSPICVPALNLDLL